MRILTERNTIIFKENPSVIQLATSPENFPLDISPSILRNLNIIYPSIKCSL
jgi:hypothetical protein